MDEKSTISWDKPYKQFPAGALFKFVCAPPRWEGDGPRAPEGALLGKAGSILDGPFHDSHAWGGIFEVLVEGAVIEYWGDFMEEIA